MLVTIIIPVFNVSDYIERCLLSVFSQTYDNIEVLLINDCTPDNSISIAKELVLKYSFGEKVQVIEHETNQGLSIARNTGLGLAKGDYVYFLDSDDCLMPDTIDFLLKIASDTSSDLVMGEVDIINPSNSYKVPNIKTLYSNNTLLENNTLIRQGFFERKWKEIACNKLIKRSFILKNNLYFEPGIYHEDTLWAFNLSLVAQRMSFCQKKTYTYFLRENSITTNKNQKHVLDKIYIYNKFLEPALTDKTLCKNISYLNYIGNFRLNLLFEITTYDYSFFKESIKQMPVFPCFNLSNILNKGLNKRIRLMIMANILPTKVLFNLMKRRIN